MRTLRSVLAGMLAVLLLAAAAASLSACGRKNLDKIPKDKDASLTPQQVYDKGMTLLRRGRYYRARGVLEKVLSRSNAGQELIANTNLAVADAYYYDGGVVNVAEALSRYTSFLNFYPDHPRADYAQYQLGLCYLKQALGPDKDQSTTRQALDCFKKVEQTYPTSDFVIVARQKADECRERLAAYDERIAIFYMQRKAWAGSAERLRALLETYPRYSHRDRVYFYLGECLSASNKHPEAALYYQKVVDEYPKSRYATQARAALDADTASPGRKAEAPKEKKSSAVREISEAEPVKGG